MRDLFQQKSFLQSIFNAIPILTFVLDKDVKVRAVNQAAKKFLNYKEEFNSFKSCGETLGCRHAADHPLGCGYGQLCRECIVRKAALAARKGKVTQRLRGRLELQPNKDLSVLVSASCFYYKNDLFSVVMIEDISLIVELKGLIPICASCKRIRDDQGYWNRVEKFIEEHTGAEFTHDICPECIKKLYSEEIKVNDN